MLLDFGQCDTVRIRHMIFCLFCAGQVVQPGVLDKAVSLFWSLVNGIAYL